ncbi:hypothetical protein BBI01_02930 [Chryseobacterium artocarpi]|uniref:Uncharacterized protein n=1 Tax=Chryseobacterium artocarpi TaxID=1414727 RepID=A0A1B9A0V4_9FLAO|nr:hypothetical protein BBI01_02930 [Chryseobacterium artocarpi]
MPKDKNGISVCETHINQQLINDKYYTASELPLTAVLSDSLYLKSMSCPMCEYLEFLVVGKTELPKNILSPKT